MVKSGITTKMVEIDNISIAVIEFFNSIEKVRKDKIYIALSGGRSLEEFYKCIVEHCVNLDQELWNKIIFCLADERLVDVENDYSNYKLLKDLFISELISKGKIREEQFPHIDINNPNYLSEYNEKIERIDIGLFGSGEDGHICSLFPNHESMEDHYENYILIHNSPKPPSNRVSLSKVVFKNILTSFIFFVGESKSHAYKNFKSDDLGEIDCPAKLTKKSTEIYVFRN